MEAIEVIVLFDLDGTLIDQKRTILKCLNLVLRKHGKAYTLEELEPLIGKPLVDVLSNKVNADVDKLIREYREIYVRNYIKSTTLYPSIRDLLQFLREKDVKIGIITTKRGSITRNFLEDFGIAQFFDVVVGEGDVRELKPSPMPVLYACELVREKAENCVVVGDRAEDVLAGKRAGTETIAVTWGYGKEKELMDAKPTKIVKNAEELKNFLLTRLNNFN